MWEYGCYSSTERIDQRINLGCPDFSKEGFNFGED